MVTSFVLLALAASALAAPQQFARQQFAQPALQPRAIIPIVSQSDLQNPDGSYTSSYTSGDGTSVNAQGFLKPTNDKQAVVVARQGSYTYTSPEGMPVSLSYLADEYGTHIIDQQPVGAPPQRF